MTSIRYRRITVADGQKVIGLDDETLERACRAGDRISEKVNGRACPIRLGFIRASSAGAVPPMIRMLRGGYDDRHGRGGELRLKVYLSMLWLASGEGHTVSFPAYAWAHLLGLDDAAGKRRVQDAISWLATEKFVVVERRPGQSSIIQVRKEDGSGAEYTKPYKLGDGDGPPKQPKYRRLDEAWWTKGWMAALSGAALVTWLAFLDDEGAEIGSSRWISTSQTKTKYALSLDTRKKGIGELLDWGLLDKSIGKPREAFVTSRPITSYRLDRHVLNSRQPNRKQKPSRGGGNLPLELLVALVAQADRQADQQPSQDPGRGSGQDPIRE
jgi:hypothetical protein